MIRLLKPWNASCLVPLILSKQSSSSVEKAGPIIGMPRVFGRSREFVVIMKQRQQTRRARQPILVGKSSPGLFVWIDAM